MKKNLKNFHFTIGIFNGDNRYLSVEAWAEIFRLGPSPARTKGILGRHNPL